jgi:hydroxymethylpyrimidine pyrophosphatase-like HAD family hydrolase
VSKATALERVRGWLDVPLDRVIAVGDGGTTSRCSRGPARPGGPSRWGQAPAEVRAAAAETAADVDHAGLAAVLDSLP